MASTKTKTYWNVSEVIDLYAVAYLDMSTPWTERVYFNLKLRRLTNQLKTNLTRNVFQNILSSKAPIQLYEAEPEFPED